MLAVSAVQMKSVLIELRFTEVLLREVIFMETSLVKDIFSLASCVSKIESVANIKKYKFDLKIQISRPGNIRLTVPYGSHSLELSSVCTLEAGPIFPSSSQAAALCYHAPSWLRFHYIPGLCRQLHKLLLVVEFDW